MAEIPSLDESALKSLSGLDPEIFPYLPYLLQDLWSLGSTPEPIIRLIEKNGLDKEFDRLRILDLGCGKGAVSIPIAKQFDAEIVGIDALPEFINTARLKAAEWGVSVNCSFLTGDIREELEIDIKFNVVLLASVGQVFGNVADTLLTLEKYLIPGGYIILDDGYLPDGMSNSNIGYPSKYEYFKMIAESNFINIDEYVHQSVDNEKINSDIFDLIKLRAFELIEKFPGSKNLFMDYLEAQSSENEILENSLVTSVLLLQKKFN